MNQSSSAEHDVLKAIPRKEFFLNREISWLEFNKRVLCEALDKRTPLLDRASFLAIFNSNLDEYVQKRVGGLKRQMQLGLNVLTPDGLTPKQQHLVIREKVLEMLEVQGKCFTQVIKPALKREKIELLSWVDLDQADRQWASDYFQKNLFPVLTPLAVDPGHPFPFISNLSLSLGVILRLPETDENVFDSNSSEIQFARVKVPSILPRWVELESQASDIYRFIPLEEIIRYNLDELFEGMIIDDVMPFRITRNADIERDDDDAEDLLNMIEQELRDRRFASVVRLEVPKNANAQMTRFLMDELELDSNDVYYMPDKLDYTDLWMIHGIARPDLKYKSWTPVQPARLIDEDADIFNIIRAGDVLVHHPYESFSASVERFIRSAAGDPRVVAIKITLYRTSIDSPFIPELIRAAEAGKQVVCLVELKARFDEARNVQIAQALEKAGVHVVYGLVGLKTHTKIAMVVRHEADGMCVYGHIGTGNYNSKTASIYTDLGLFTCQPGIINDLVNLFHHLTGRSVKNNFEHLLVAPINMKSRFYDFIANEVKNIQAWKQRGGALDDPTRPRIIAKMNSLEDRGICEKLYEASQAGVQIDLLVRGFCCLRPQVPGLSENIHVISVIGPFLEHSRIFYFYNDGKPKFYMGSADWMYRNLNNRVECITPILEPMLQQRLLQILEIMIADHRQAWDMQADGNYIQRTPPKKALPDKPEMIIGTHQRLMNITRRDAMLLERSEHHS